MTSAAAALSDPGPGLIDLALLAALDEVAEALDGVIDVDVAGVEGGHAEPHAVGTAEVGDDVGPLDQGAADGPGFGVVEGHVRAAPLRAPRRAEGEAERGQPLVVQG